MRVTFTPPAGSDWTIATQLFPTSDAQHVHGAEPAVLHGQPDRARALRLQHVRGAQRRRDAVELPSGRALRRHAGRRRRAGEDRSSGWCASTWRCSASFPKYEPGHYTFLLDYVAVGRRRRHGTPQQHVDLESGPVAEVGPGRRQALGTISHEFFHNWNVERIRPVGLEPFDFTRANVTCCLWLAEGFTQYYGPLLLYRVGLQSAGADGRRRLPCRTLGPPASGRRCR